MLNLNLNFLFTDDDFGNKIKGFKTMKIFFFFFSTVYFDVMK